MFSSQRALLHYENCFSLHISFSSLSNLVLYHELIAFEAGRHLFETASLAPLSGNFRYGTSHVLNLPLPTSPPDILVSLVWTVGKVQAASKASGELILILIFLLLTPIKLLWTLTSYLTYTNGSVLDLKVPASGSLRSGIFFFPSTQVLTLLFVEDNICSTHFPIPIPSHPSLSASLRVFVPGLAGSRWQQLPRTRWGIVRK